MATHLVPVLESLPETPRDRTLVLPVPEGASEAFRFEPGQFLTLRDPSLDPATRRAYSLSGSPREHGVLRLTVRADGRMGAHLCGLAPGSPVEISRPQGRFLLRAPAGRAVVLVAGGAGVGPFRSLVRSLRETGRADPVTLLASARSPEEALFREEMEATAAASAWFCYLPTVTRAPEAPWPGRRGRIDAALLAEALRGARAPLLYACGPTAFVEAVVALAREAGLPDEDVRREKWG